MPIIKKSNFIPEPEINYYTKRQRNIRTEIIKKLGGKCKNCGFSDPRALQIDHIDGKGNKELRNGYGGGLSYYYKVFRDTTGKYQLLCANCNWIKRAENRESGGRNQHKLK